MREVHAEAHRADGTVEKEAGGAWRGSETYSASGDDIIETFRKLALKALPEECVERLVDTVLDLEGRADTGRFAELLSTGLE